MSLLPEPEKAAASYLAAVSTVDKLGNRISSVELSTYGAIAMFSALGVTLGQERVRAAMVRTIFKVNPESVPTELRSELVTAEDMACAMLGIPISDGGLSKQICP